MGKYRWVRLGIGGCSVLQDGEGGETIVIATTPTVLGVKRIIAALEALDRDEITTAIDDIAKRIAAEQFGRPVE